MDDNLKLKVGILLQSFQVNKFQKEIIDTLNKEKKIDLYAIFEGEGKNLIKKSILNIKKKSINANTKILFFKIIFFFEKFILTIFFKDLKEIQNNFNVNKKIFKKIFFIKNINLSKKLKKNKFNNFHRILNQNFNLIINTAVDRDILNNELKNSKFRVLSLNSGIINKDVDLSGFWETYLNKPQTNFTIQLKDTNSKSNKILFEGQFATKRFFSINKHYLLKESSDFFIKIMKEILLNKKTVLNDKKEYKSKKFIKIPTIIDTLKYLVIKIKLLFILLFKKYVLLQKQRWQIGYFRNNFTKFNLKDSIKIDNLKDHFFADPFVVLYKQKHFIFVEDYCFKNKKGSISVIEINKDDTYKIYKNIIKESFHMSFPFIFKFKNNYYMIPETHLANSLKLYKCVKFPNKWVFHKNMIDKINCVDTIMINEGKKYYLITTESNNNEFNSNLSIYISNNPVSNKWKKHKLNQIHLNTKRGRNGGVIYNNKKLFRVSQSFGINYLGDNQYGHKISIKLIKKLNHAFFHEKKVGEIKPKFKKKILGIHTMNGIDKFTTFDYCYYK